MAHTYDCDMCANGASFSVTTSGSLDKLSSLIDTHNELFHQGEIGDPILCVACELGDSKISAEWGKTEHLYTGPCELDHDS